MTFSTDTTWSEPAASLGVFARHRASEGRRAVLFMAIERFRHGDAKAVYRRVRDGEGSLPDGLRYAGSWIDASLQRCFELVECEDVRLLHLWVASWSDLIDYEIVPVLPSKDTRENITAVL